MSKKLTGVAALPGGGPTSWKPGQSGNPGGAPSIKNDLKRASLLGVPPEVNKTLDEWFAEASERLQDLGAQAFVAQLKQALDDAVKRTVPMDTQEARAWWWRTIWPIFLAGPSGTKDSVWIYTAGEMGNRLLGKPKEHVVLEDGTTTPIDWKRVPEERRAALGAAILELQGYFSEPANNTEH